MNTPTIEIFSIGTELVMGRIQDTNSHWIAQQVAQLGGKVRRITLVPDDVPDIIDCLQDSIQRNTDILISTGGLGPTPDDVTVECVSTILGTPASVHEPTLQDYMRRRNLTSRDQLTPNLINMATVPSGAEVMQNPVGWAPCILARQEETCIFILPGPPKEMEALFTLYVARYISENYATKSASLRVLVNMYESEVSPLMESVMERFPGSYLKAYVALRESVDHNLPVDVVAAGADAAEAQRTLQQAVEYFAHLVTENGKRLEYYED